MTMLSFLYTLTAHPLIPIFLFLNLAVALWAHRKAKVNSFEDYALASRSLPTGVLVMTLLATLVARGDLWQSDYAFQYGIIDMVTLIAWVVAFLITGTCIAPLLVYFMDCTTMGDLMRIFYGRIAQIFTGLVGGVICILMISSQIRAAYVLIEALSPFDATVIILCFGFCVILYSALGGMRSVSYTDVLQGGGILLVLLWITHTMMQQLDTGSFWGNLPEGHKVFLHASNLMFKIKLSFFWALFPTFIFTPPVMQRMLIVQDKRKVRKVWYLIALLSGTILFLMIVIGLAAYSGKEKFGLTDGDKNILIKVTLSLFRDHSHYIDVILLVYLSVLFSTIDSFLHAFGITFIQDVLNPLSSFLYKKDLKKQQKLRLSKLVTVLIGFLSLIIGILGKNLILYTNVVLISGMILVPLLIGLIGIKTDKVSWSAYLVAYVTSLILFKLWGWHRYSYFPLIILVGLASYFLTHLIRNGGIVTLKRSEMTIAERLWIPNWADFIKKMGSSIKALFHLHTIANRKVASTPTQSLAFSMLIFALYTFSSIMSTEGVDTANFMAAIHLVGITLCCGLMLEGIWSDKLKLYFALYWYVTLFYCLPFGGTLAFLRVYEANFAFVLFLASFILLGSLVDSKSFFTMGSLGFACALGIWKLSMGAFPQDFWYHDATIKAFSLIAVLAIGILLFERNKEKRTEKRLYWNRIASSILGHDVRSTTQMLGGAGYILERTLEIGEPITNDKGEKGYWLPFAQSRFLEEFSGKMIEKAADSRKEIASFLSFIQNQVIGTFEQQAVSMRAIVQQGIHKVKTKIEQDRIKLIIEEENDFKVKVLAGIFPNVIMNLIQNASFHGKATEIKVQIDGNKHTITVRDNGKGIASDILPRIFDLNYSTAPDEKENLGIGLAFAKMVLDTSAAKISCHSRTGKDSFTEFVMTFPKA